jgi:hypothetical protein
LVVVTPEQHRELHKSEVGGIDGKAA